MKANKAFAEKHGYRFPLLSDPEKKAAAAYGVLGPAGFAKRWTFVIDDQGIIRAIDRAVKPASYGQDLARMLTDLGIPTKE